MAWEQGTRNMWGRSLDEDRPARLTIRDPEGNVLSAWGGADPCAPDGFSAPHGLWVDSHGDIYVGEVSQTALTAFYQRTSWHAGCHSLIKFARI